MAAAKKWSGKVTATSDAMDVAGGTFSKRSPRAIARAIEHDAERSDRRKASPYRSAMSMLTFYINRAGRNLTAEQRGILERAKEILREEFGPKVAAQKKATRKTPARKTSARKASQKRKAKR